MEPLGSKYNSLDGLVKWYAVLLSVMLFVAYPIALFIPLGHGAGIFNFFFPAFLLATAGSVAMLLFIKRTGKKYGIVEIACGVYFLSLLVSTLVNGAAGADFMTYAGVGLVPLSVALAMQYNRELFLKIFQWAVFVLLLVNLIHCYHRLPSINSVGISGNQNWLSALILAAVPVAGIVVKKLLAGFIKSDKAAWITSLLILSVISLPVIIKTDSRASYTALILLPFFIAFVYFGKKVKIGIGIFLLLCAVAAPVLFKGQIDREMKRNVRLPLWSASIDMILANPLGAGPEMFEYKFPEYAHQDQKKMLVSAETTVHPHNEFLNVAAIGGIAAAVSWLVLVVLALFSRPEKFEDWCFSAALFILFIQGMMDKPLYQMPTMLLFYLLLGVVLSRQSMIKLVLSKPVREKRKLYGLMAVIILASCCYLVAVTTLSSWYERRGIQAESSGDKKSALLYFDQSFQTARWRLFPAYKAFIICTIDQPDLQKAIDYYSVIEEKAPDLRQFNLLKGAFFTQLAIQDREKTPEHLKNAWASYNRACELNSTNVLSYVDRLRFAAGFMNEEALNTSYKSLVSLYGYKAEAGAAELKVDLKEWGKKWLRNSKYSEFLVTTNLFMGMMKPALVQSVYYPADMNHLTPLFQGGYQISDMVYATDAMVLERSYKDKNPIECFEEILTGMKESDRPFSWPLETFKSKQGNRISIYALAAMVMRNKGYDSFLVMDEKGMNLVLQKGDQFLLSDGTMLNEISLIKLTEFLKGKTVKYFDYPQAFFYKNEFLSYVLSKSQATPQYCRNPDFVINNFMKRFPSGLFKFEILKDPFSDISQKMQGGRRP